MFNREIVICRYNISDFCVADLSKIDDLFS
jgi:hypothetical protein